MNLYQARKYLKYILFSSHKKGHQIHSPFLFNLIEKVFRNKTVNEVVLKIEGSRKRMLTDPREIDVIDFGTGENKGSVVKRTVSRITCRSSVPSKYGRLLMNLSTEFGGGCILELGTSVGIGTMYLAAGSPGSGVHTIEGCPGISGIAKENFGSLGFSNIEVHTGKFSEILVKLKQMNIAPGIIFIDGDHRKQNVLEYFEFLCGLSNERTVMVFDDINMNSEMGEAWGIISADKRISLSIDIFRMGIVFFRKGLTPSSWVIRY